MNSKEALEKISNITTYSLDREFQSLALAGYEKEIACIYKDLELLNELLSIMKKHNINDAKHLDKVLDLYDYYIKEK